MSTRSKLTSEFFTVLKYILNLCINGDELLSIEIIYEKDTFGRQLVVEYIFHFKNHNEITIPEYYFYSTSVKIDSRDVNWLCEPMFRETADTDLFLTQLFMPKTKEIVDKYLEEEIIIGIIE